ncbi:MAG: diguanylate cyclase [Betaproteobacteria bacterium HGW-Betaproteobacteria-7]|jgi:diguanylate cyclase (GGDEF)-like protein/PAS domain S-box-containing protein|nr:MAG: diguanylate cyclase [Betaproteobacteria bacterium HGW-Betaproteobacteria-7]
MSQDQDSTQYCCAADVQVAPGAVLPDLCAIQYAILENAGSAIIATDVAGTILYFNRAAQQMLGYAWHEVVGRATPELFHAPEEVAARIRLLDDSGGAQASGFAALVSRVASEGRDDGAWVYVRKDGSRLHVQLTITALRNAADELIGYLGIAADIGERLSMEQELRVAAIAFESQAAIMVTDHEQRILRVNPAFTKLTGYSAEEAVGCLPSMLKSGRQDRQFYQAMWRELEQTGHWQGEIWNRRKSGEIYPEWLTISAVCDAKGALSHYVSTFSDISNLKVAESEIHHLAFYDPLTDLPNRRLLLNRLDKAGQAARRSGHYGALLFIDLDHFKTLNDTLGHDVGDSLLVEVAGRLRGCISEGDTAARQGGDEFAVMLEELGSDAAAAAVQAETVAEHIRSELTRPFRLADGSEHFSSASIGISLFFGLGGSVEALVKQADIALYRAKDAGRNMVRFFDNAMQTALHERAALESGLRSALVRNEFVLFVQPQVDCSGRLRGAECLIRWQPAGRPAIMPGDFVPLAEASGLIVPIGLWVLDEACAQLRRWAERAPSRDLYLAVNVSACQFRQPDFVAQVQAALQRHGADPARLKIELTESLLLDNVDQVVDKMQALQAIGVCFSLDDFGTGYASLAYLKRFPFEQLKIDRSFIRDIASDPDDAAIVSAIVAMGNALRLNVVAEGVETEEQRAYLIEHGCRGFQGYLFGRPMPFADFDARLAGLDN